MAADPLVTTVAGPESLRGVAAQTAALRARSQRLARQLEGTDRGQARGCGPLRQVVSRRVAGRVLLVGDAAGYEDALTGEGISLAVKQAAAAVDAIVEDTPSSYEAAWHRVTRDYRLLTRALVLASTPRVTRRAIVPACTLLPGVFRRGVNVLAH